MPCLDGDTVSQMPNRICVVDYACEWALKDRYQNQVPRSRPGCMSREDVVAFYGTLGVDGIELMHFYWHDYPAAELRKLTGSHGAFSVATTSAFPTST